MQVVSVSQPIQVSTLSTLLVRNVLGTTSTSFRGSECTHRVLYSCVKKRKDLVPINPLVDKAVKGEDDYVHR